MGSPIIDKKNMKKTLTQRIFVLLLATIFWQNATVHAQDAVFGQFYAAPMNLNPAMTGVFGGQWRANINYRQQWTNIFSDFPLQTLHAGFDYKFRVMDDDFLCVGADFLRDELGGDARLNRTYGNLSLSFMKQLNGSRYRSGDQYLILGLQGGVGQHAMGGNSLWFDRQFDPLAANVNTNLPTGELTPQAGKIYPDFNAGLMWYSVMDDNQSIYVGISGHHILQPNISFFNNSKENLYRRFSLNFGGEVPISQQLSLLPGLLATLQGPSMTTAFGTNFRYSNHDWN
ncbi:MAG: hypothetical protein RL757_2006, partial [Bacteroidota bacterium]